jgi:hypothetical protein
MSPDPNTSGLCHTNYLADNNVAAYWNFCDSTCDDVIGVNHLDIEDPNVEFVLGDVGPGTNPSCRSAVGYGGLTNFCKATTIYGPLMKASATLSCRIYLSEVLGDAAFIAISFTKFLAAGITMQIANDKITAVTYDGTGLKLTNADVFDGDDTVGWHDIAITAGPSNTLDTYWDGEKNCSTCASLDSAGVTWTGIADGRPRIHQYTNNNAIEPIKYEHCAWFNRKLTDEEICEGHRFGWAGLGGDAGYSCTY